MAGSLQLVFSVLVFVTVALTALAIGLLTTSGELRDAVRRPRFVAVVLVNLVVVPAIGWLVIRVFGLPTEVETGLLLCVICAGGPLALKAGQIARTDLSWTLSLTVSLLVLNVISLPLWTGVMIGRSMTLRVADLVGVLVVAILSPVALGAVMGTRRPGRRLEWSKSLTTVSNITFVAAIALGVVGAAQTLEVSLTSGALVVSAVVIALSGLIGFAVRDETTRVRATSIVTMNRATSVALLVMARVFPGEPEIFTAAVVYGLVQTTVALGLSLVWRKTSGSMGLQGAGPAPTG